MGDMIRIPLSKLEQAAPIFAGYSVRQSEYLLPEPKIILSYSCPVSEGCRRSFNQWALELFGLEEPFFYYCPSDKTIFCNGYLADYIESTIRSPRLQFVEITSIGDRITQYVPGGYR